MSIERTINTATDIADIGVNNAFMFAGGSTIGAAASSSAAATVTAGMIAPIAVTTATVAGALIGGWKAVTTGRDIYETCKQKKFENLGHQVPFFLSYLTSVPTFGTMGLLNLSHFVTATAPHSTAAATLAVGAGVAAPVAPVLGITFAALMGIGSSVLAARSYATRRTLHHAKNTEEVKGLVEKNRFAFSASLSKIIANSSINEPGLSTLIEVAKKDNARQIKKYLVITAVALTMIAAFALMIAFPPGIMAIAIISGVLFIALGAMGLYLNPLRQNDEKYEEKLRVALGLSGTSPLEISSAMTLDQ